MQQAPWQQRQEGAAAGRTHGERSPDVKVEIAVFVESDVGGWGALADWRSVIGG